MRDEVGPERPTSAIQRGVYIGDRKDLRHKAAYISRCEGGWAVQVDDMMTGFGLGWWRFSFEDWRVT
jgi:hypothetical protein